MGIAEQLSAFVAGFEGQPVEWGVSDCSAVPCSWIGTLGIRVVLPSYRSRDQAHAIIARYGSLVATWDACLAGTGIGERYGEPFQGDIAIVDTRTLGQIGGIVSNGRILIVRRDDGGFTWFGPVRQFAKVWAIV